MNRTAILKAIEVEQLARGIESVVKAESKLDNSPNHLHAAYAVLRTARLKSVGNWILTGLKSRLDQLQAEIASELQANSPVVKSNEEKVLANIEKRILNAYAQMSATVKNQFKELAAIVGEHNAKTLERHHNLRTKEADHSNIHQTLVLGAPLSEHFKKMGEDVAFKVKAEIRQGVANDETTEQLVERITNEEPVKARETIKAGAPSSSKDLNDIVFAIAEIPKSLTIGIRLFDSVENSLDKVIQSAIQSFSNAVDEASFEALPETEKNMGWAWLGVADDRQCDECSFYDGSQWDSEYEPIGDAPEYPGNPPAHFSCRCSVLPVDLDEPMPADAQFDDYLNQFSREEKESAFGAANYREYQRGNLTPAQLMGQDSNEISLEDFRKSEPTLDYDKSIAERIGLESGQESAQKILERRATQTAEALGV